MGKFTRLPPCDELDQGDPRSEVEAADFPSSNDASGILCSRTSWGLSHKAQTIDVRNLCKRVICEDASQETVQELRSNVNTNFQGKT
jgi:hypothetical protein